MTAAPQGQRRLNSEEGQSESSLSLCLYPVQLPKQSLPDYADNPVLCGPSVPRWDWRHT